MSNPHESSLRAERGSELVEIAGEKVALGYDPDGEVWFVRASSVPGLAATAATRDELLDELPLLIRQALLP
ncbi:DUF1902 domain-containing protein [Enterovirga aerilata]|uniref:DUF1902 domain-containing protein n=1 Tax=Enterovirga aerilata TaxID=2730920 RepID=A0A849I1A3_9HYPH|nr:DUF1902 domain-containing protein [Enterovirga sp. DB1703]NNM73556.1 DUF1902 domain-containing protein [Enterovirga sp. DB1703]